MKKTFSPFILLMCFGCMVWMFTNTGCANIIPPGGGPLDSLPPVLVASTPRDSSTNTTANKITLSFNEYVEVQNAQENVLVSPTPDNMPLVDYRLRTVTIKLKDTLEPNTTYSINFGNAIKDVNEGNVLKNFIYVFSTGKTIDNNTLSGKVVLSETGGTDSSLIVVLHRNLDDSAVAKDKPRYIAKLDGQGNFIFHNLPEGTFALYTIPNEYSKRYDDSTKLFAFNDKPVVISKEAKPIVLYAYNYPKVVVPPKPAGTTGGTKTTNAATQDKVIKYSSNLQVGGKQDLFTDLILSFNRKVFRFDSNSVLLTTKDFTPVANYHFTADTNNTRFHLSYKWAPEQQYNLLIKKEAFVDSAGLMLARNDTLKISTKRNEDYGSIKLRFNNLDLSKNPVMLFLQGDKIVESSPLTQRDWSRKFYEPGEYDIRILYDTNKNGKWDPGKFFGVHQQPEIVRDLKIKLVVRANWDNEKEISL
jgi:hypothetical protein